MTAVRKIIQFPSRPRQRREYETAFLPAALEVVETPPSPIGRAVGLTIVLLFCAALAWASLGKVDVVATAPGKIVVNGRTKVIQPAETGVVRAIHVRDGTTVKAGDVLIIHYRTRFLTVRVLLVPERVVPSLKPAEMYEIIDERKDDARDWL